MRSYTQLCVVGVVKSLCASLAETGADGLLVELNAGDPFKAAQLQVGVGVGGVCPRRSKMTHDLSRSARTCCTFTASSSDSHALPPHHTLCALI